MKNLLRLLAVTSLVYVASQATAVRGCLNQNSLTADGNGRDNGIYLSGFGRGNGHILADSGGDGRSGFV